MNREFNLLKEPWIRVIGSDSKNKEVSITEAIVNAHLYADLAGEVPGQDFAILRVLLAIAHTVISRYRYNGESSQFDTEDDALERWKEYWDRRCFPEEVFKRYLEAFEDSFWLFHPDKPFWQALSGEKGTQYPVAKLNGEILESNNKIRIMSEIEDKDSMTYEEAARWLIYLNGFDDASQKAKQKGLPPIGVGYLAKLSPIMCRGDNLFETLMLNLVLLNGNSELWGKNKPVWELKNTPQDERREVVIPDNQAELLTMQSRRIMLKRDGDKLIGYSTLGGDFFELDNAFSEQMTMWRYDEKKDTYKPKERNPEVQLWRSFNTLCGVDVESDRNGVGRAPGIVSWVRQLKKAGILPKNKIIRFKTLGIEYENNSSVVNSFQDSLDLYAGVLEQNGKSWQILILNEIKKCEEIEKKIKWLATDIYLSSGGDYKKKDVYIKQQVIHFYDLMDMPFRRWIATLKPDDDALSRDERREEWRRMVRSLCEQFLQDIVRNLPESSIMGREITIKKNGVKERRSYSAARSINQFRYELKRILQI